MILMFFLLLLKIVIIMNMYLHLTMKILKVYWVI